MVVLRHALPWVVLILGAASASAGPDVLGGQPLPFEPGGPDLGHLIQPGASPGPSPTPTPSPTPGPDPTTDPAPPGDPPNPVPEPTPPPSPEPPAPPEPISEAIEAVQGLVENALGPRDAAAAGPAPEGAAAGPEEAIPAAASARAPDPPQPWDGIPTSLLLPEILAAAALSRAPFVRTGLRRMARAALRLGAALQALFTRLTRDDVLHHPLRQRLFELIRSRPGIHFRELLRSSLVPNGVLQWHLDKLVQSGVIGRNQGYGFTCYFVAGQIDRRRMDASSVTKSDGARRVLASLQIQPAASLDSLARTARLDPRAARFHVSRLSERGLVTVERSGRNLSIAATPSGRMVGSELVP